MADSTTPFLFDESLHRVSGIYSIQHIASKKIYIGSTNNLYVRRRGHFSKLRRNCHDNEYLQNAYNKYGRKAFRFAVIEECNVEKLIEREQYWIDFYQAANSKLGYNIAPMAGGRAQSEETRAKISKTLKGRIKSIEHRKNLSRALIGHPATRKGAIVSEVTRKKLSEKAKGNQKFKGRKHSPETIEKMKEAQRASWAKGKNVSDEAKQRAREKRLAWWTPERRAERSRQKRLRDTQKLLKEE